ncbi:phage tail-collar fiber domain-containing protein [Providencia sp. PROV076]|uniref:phage tail-collar fiber domain-containing protein n=1 Tax=Providencia sp. PROV076 TaxID=2949798 RepID=UPI00234B5B95|nr:phage tail protein [Providencia sp. PROV076]
MKYFALLTKLGENLLAQATALGTKLELTHMAVGDGGGSLPTPDTNQTKLIAEKRRAAINTLFIDDKNKNQIIAEQIIPESEGGWFIREIGLFDKAGNLIAVANCPETYKPQLTEGSGRTQSIRMVLIVSHTESVTLKIDPSVVLATREYVNTEITVIDKKIDALSAQTKLDLNKKFDKANISGVLGNDNDKVPSLNLLATELGKKQPKGDYADGNRFTINGTDVSIKTPNNNSSFDLGNTGWISVKNLNTNKITFSVDSAGRVGNCLIPVECGGTGAKNASDARNNLSLYSKEEVNASLAGKISKGENGLFADIGSTPSLTVTKAQYDIGFRGSVQMSKSESPYSSLIDGTVIITRINDYSAKRGFELAYKVRGKDLCVGFSTSGNGTTENWEYAKVYTGFNVTEDHNGGLKTLGTVGLSDYPVGAPIPWAQSTAPSGFLVCNGQSFNKTTYPLLAKAYPTGVLPDLRGEFLRGLDAGRNIDSGRAVLSAQGDAIRNIKGSLGKSFKTNIGEGAGTGAIRSVHTSEKGGVSTESGAYGSLDFDASRDVPTANENRPRNIAFLYIVRAA